MKGSRWCSQKLAKAMSRIVTISSYCWREPLDEVDAGVLVEAAEDLGVHPGDAVGGLQEALAVRVLADGQQDLADGTADAVEVDRAVLGGRPGPGVAVSGVVVVIVIVVVVEHRGAVPWVERLASTRGDDGAGNQLALNGGGNSLRSGLGRCPGVNWSRILIRWRARTSTRVSTSNACFSGEGSPR